MPTSRMRRAPNRYARLIAPMPLFPFVRSPGLPRPGRESCRTQFRPQRSAALRSWVHMALRRLAALNSAMHVLHHR